MSSINVNDSPNHFMVLDAIARGIRNPDKIAKVTRLNKPIVELVNDLTNQRLATITEKRGFLGNRKIELSITETGNRLLMTKKQELEQQWNQIQRWYNNGERGQLQSYMDSNRGWIPMMLFSGIMNMMFFMSMMSFMGMAMSGVESGLANDAGADSSGSGDVQSVSDGGGADAGGADAGVGDFGGGDFSF